MTMSAFVLALALSACVWGGVVDNSDTSDVKAILMIETLALVAARDLLDDVEGRLCLAAYARGFVLDYVLYPTRQAHPLGECKRLKKELGMCVRDCFVCSRNDRSLGRCVFQGSESHILDRQYAGVFTRTDYVENLRTVHRLQEHFDTPRLFVDDIDPLDPQFFDKSTFFKSAFPDENEPGTPYTIRAKVVNIISSILTLLMKNEQTSSATTGR